MRHEGGFLVCWFLVSGPRMAKMTLVPSAEVSTSFTSHSWPAVMRAVMFVSLALAEALARMNRSADGTMVRMMRRSSCCRVPSAFAGTWRFT